jgi:hypothetical protein
MEKVDVNSLMDYQSWQIDSSQCNGCLKPFTFFLRKHHCRVCMQIFCHDCCHYNYNGQRMCSGCVENHNCIGCNHKCHKRIKCVYKIKNPSNTCSYCDHQHHGKNKCDYYNVIYCDDARKEEKCKCNKCGCKSCNHTIPCDCSVKCECYIDDAFAPYRFLQPLWNLYKK